MARVRLIWVWLIALMIAATMVGCGDDAPDPGTPPDAATDRRSDAPDVRTDGADVRTDILPDTTADVRTDPPIGIPDADASRPPDADATVPPPDRAPDTIDVRTDADASQPPPPPDADASPPPPPPDADASPPPPDTSDAAFCTNDNQCPSNVPHCNTTTGQCVSRTSIAVTPPNPTIALGTTRQFTATVTYSDNSTGNVTTQVTWTSATPATATINANTGLATSVAVGTTLIQATLAGLSGGTTLTVSGATLSSLSVTPAPEVSLPIGLTQPFIVTGTYSDTTTQDLTTQATWTSSETNIATIGTNTGVALGVAVGDSTITAAFGGQTATSTLRVTAATLQSLTVTPQNRTIGRQTTQPFVVTGTYSDNTSQNLTALATWTSSDISIATVSDLTGSKGLATGISAGVARITAAYGGISGFSDLTVTGATLSSITVSPAAPTIANGLVVQFQATATYSDATTQNLTTLVTWTSSDTGIAIISNAPGSQGLATSVAPGSTIVTATLGSVQGTANLTVSSALLVSIEVAPTLPTIAKGTTRQFTATGTYTDHTTLDITTQVTWGSNNAGVAPISNALGTEGRATGSAAGTATISATLSGITQSTLLTVTDAVLTAIGITPLAPSIAKGNQVQFAAIGTYSDQTQVDVTATATWNSSNAAVASVGNTAGSYGLAFGVDVGTATISAAIGTIAGSTTLTVTQAELVSIALTPPNPSIPKGTTRQFTATGTYTDNTTQDLTELASWSSGNGGVATVSNTAGSIGLATANNNGSTTITANYNGVSGSTGITVTAAQLTAITITPSGASSPAGTDRPFLAIGAYSDGHSEDITLLVTWESSNHTFATISNTAGSRGVAHAVAPGTVNITATSGTIVGTTEFQVTPATLQTIQVTPPSPTIPKGTTQQFVATGIYSDNTAVPLTADVVWSSSSTSTATISNVGVNKGLATGINAGASTISATYLGTTGTATLTVTDAALQSITVAPGAQQIAAGTTIQLIATGHYSDATTRNVTALADWASNDTAHATVNNVGVGKGIVTGVAPGGATITATFSIAGSTTITVTSATLNSIAVTPASPSIAKGTTQQFVATGTYSDTTTQILTADVTWGSSATQFATVSNNPSTKGLATGVNGPGSSNITASLNGVTGAATLAVTGATLTSVTVTPANGNVAVNGTVQYTATGSYSDATQQNITALCVWDSLTPATASISNAAGSVGLATAAAVGTTTITATCPATPTPVPGSTGLTVTP
jgi:trimeric autotransporter adhesin